MIYADGQIVNVGDIVEVDMPDGRRIGRVAAIGDTGEHENIPEDILEWIKSEDPLGPRQIIVEWMQSTGSLRENASEYNPPPIIIIEVGSDVVKVDDISRSGQSRAET